jgi:REP element-mobilizing transposase RayT
MKAPIQERKHRLDHELYRGIKWIHFTLCIKDHKPFFVEMKQFLEAERILLSELTRFHCSAEVYMFMPDHAHVLLKGDADTSDALQAIKSFKQKSGYWLSKKYPSIHWQKDFYDHILRSEGKIQQHVLYILNNPVRKEITLDWKDYPYKGSTVHRFSEW